MPNRYPAHVSQIVRERGAGLGWMCVLLEQHDGNHRNGDPGIGPDFCCDHWANLLSLLWFPFPEGLARQISDVELRKP